MAAKNAAICQRHKLLRPRFPQYSDASREPGRCRYVIQAHEKSAGHSKVLSTERIFECPATLHRVVVQSGSGTAPGAHQIIEESPEVTTYGLRKAALRSRHAFPRSSLPPRRSLLSPFSPELSIQVQQVNQRGLRREFGSQASFSDGCSAPAQQEEYPLHWFL